MLFWRLSDAAYAERLDGGYGIENEGRWNSIGRRVTYCATSPSLCVLERLVHANRLRGMPRALVMVQIDAPDAGLSREVPLDELPPAWHEDAEASRSIGDRWHDGRSSLALIVPSVVQPLRDVAERNVVLNHEHPAARRLRIVRRELFRLDARLGTGRGAAANAR